MSYDNPVKGEKFRVRGGLDFHQERNHNNIWNLACAFFTEKEYQENIGLEVEFLNTLGSNNYTLWNVVVPSSAKWDLRRVKSNYQTFEKWMLEPIPELPTIVKTPLQRLASRTSLFIE